MAASRRTCRVHFLPDDRVAEVERGESVLAAAQKAGLYISSLCGGDGICGKCRVILRSGEIVSRPTTLLDRDEIRENYILACQSTVRGDLEIEIPPETRLEEGKILGDEDAERFGRLPLLDRSEFTFRPLVRKLHLALDAPTMDSALAGHERLYQGIRAQEPEAELQTGFAVLRDLSHTLAAGNYNVTATVGRRGATTEVVQVEPGDTAAHNLGVAIDIGTTTLVVQLVDLTDGHTIDSEAKYNSQMKYGEDYIRRIMYAIEHNALDEMQRLLADDLNELIEIIVRRHLIHLHDITCAMVAGNTAMTHFLLGLDPSGIRKEPYVPVANYVPPLRAAQVGLHINPRGLLYTLPSVAAYVGADITSGVVATRLDEQKRLCLFIDVGTNGEVVLGNRDWMVCCSASAGPAFEGVGVEYGMRAARGAIERVRITPDGDVQYDTIGDRPPEGLVLRLARLVPVAGLVVDPKGRPVEGAQVRLHERVAGVSWAGRTKLTDPDGRYRFFVGLGQRFSVAPVDPFYETPDWDVDCGGPEMKHIVAMPQRPVTLAGRVLRPGGQPAPRTRIRLTMGRHRFLTAADERGAFRFRELRLQGDALRLEAWSADRVLAAETTVAPTALGQDVLIRLAKSGMVTRPAVDD